MAATAFESLDRRAKWATAILALVAVVDALALASGIAEYQLLARAERGEFVSFSEADANDLRQAAVGIVQFGLLVVAAVFFIRWFHRAYKNLIPLGAGQLRFGPGWAIGGWFVPILSIWRPKQIANDIWRASDPGYPPGTTAWRAASVPGLFALWWAGFLASNWLSQAGLRLSISAEEVTELQRVTVMYLVADGVDLIAAVLAILVVRWTTARHEERARRFGPAS